jgi:hypothetical protein
MKRKEAEELIKEYERYMPFEEWDEKYHILEVGEAYPPEGEDGYLWTNIGADYFGTIVAGVWHINALCWYRTEFPYNETDIYIRDEFFEQEKEDLLSELED